MREAPPMKTRWRNQNKFFLNEDNLGGNMIMMMTIMIAMMVIMLIKGMTLLTTPFKWVKREHILG